MTRPLTGDGSRMAAASPEPPRADDVPDPSDAPEPGEASRVPLSLGYDVGSPMRERPLHRATVENEKLLERKLLADAPPRNRT
jgi:hypothetical protein